jgi:hypothetical protein
MPWTLCLRIHSPTQVWPLAHVRVPSLELRTVRSRRVAGAGADAFATPFSFNRPGLPPNKCCARSPLRSDLEGSRDPRAQ